MSFCQRNGERELNIPTAYRDERQVKPDKDKNQQVQQATELNKPA
jgi:hypothetical protein